MRLGCIFLFTVLMTAAVACSDDVAPSEEADVSTDEGPQRDRGTTADVADTGGQDSPSDDVEDSTSDLANDPAEEADASDQAADTPEDVGEDASDQAGDTETDRADAADSATDGGGDAASDSDGDTADSSDTATDSGDDASDAGGDTVDQADTSDGASDTGGDAATETGGDVSDEEASSGPAELVIVEIQGNPVGRNDEEAEYIELLNVGEGSANLQGMTLFVRKFTGSPPASGGASFTFTDSIVIAGGTRFLLVRSGISDDNGGLTADATYGPVGEGLEISNGDVETTRVRLVDGDNELEDPIVDEVVMPVSVFSNGSGLAGVSWQLDPADVPSPTAATNDDPDDWCLNNGLTAYFGSNFGTPGEVNDCD